jgi:hypothetical protein
VCHELSKPTKIEKYFAGMLQLHILPRTGAAASLILGPLPEVPQNAGIKYFLVSHP